MDDTDFFLEAAAAAQAACGGRRWAAFWLWCVTHGHEPMPASEETLRSWLGTLPVREGLEEVHACLLEVVARHVDMDQPHPLATSLPGGSL